MSKANPDVLQGTLDLLILKTLARGPQHGYGIAVHLQQVSDEVLRVEEGSLYPALHRIEQAGWISSDWGTSEKQSPSEVLPVDCCGPQAARQGRGELGTVASSEEDGHLGRILAGHHEICNSVPVDVAGGDPVRLASERHQ